jgi:hypothetical protein
VLVGCSDTLGHGARPGETQGPAAAGTAERPPRRRAALRPRPGRAAHLEPGRTRPTAQQRASRTSPAGSPASNAPKIATPSAATFPPRSNTAITP